MPRSNSPRPSGRWRRPPSSARIACPANKRAKLEAARSAAAQRVPQGLPARLGLATYLLPHLEHKALFDRINTELPVDSPAYLEVRTTPLAIYACPTDRSTGRFWIQTVFNSDLMEASTTSYTASMGAYDGSFYQGPENTNGMFFKNSKVRLLDVADGAATPWPSANGRHCSRNRRGRAS